MLTAKQHELLLFIHGRLSETGVSPSFEEMKDALDLKSKSGVHRLIGALEERQFLRRLPHRARALEVMRLPGEVVPVATRAAAGSPAAAPAAAGGLAAAPAAVGDPAAARAAVGDPAAARAARDAHTAHAAALRSPVAAAALSIPLVGRIAAGLPIEAIEGHEQLAVPASLLGPGEHYALEVVGDSMIDAGIFEGDFALIRKTGEAREGDIIVALIDEQDATLKYFHREAGMIRLDPANPAHQPQRYKPGRVHVQGRLAGLLRRY